MIHKQFATTIIKLYTSITGWNNYDYYYIITYLVIRNYFNNLHLTSGIRTNYVWCRENTTLLGVGQPNAIYSDKRRH